MKRATQEISVWVFIGLLMLGTVSFAQDTAGSQVKIGAGQKMKVAGLIVSRDADGFMLRNERGEDIAVKMNGSTAIKERKSNPFRGARTYDPAQLVRGLSVEVEGAGDGQGALSARTIKFTETEHKIASSVESRVNPVESRLVDTEGRLTRSEQNAQHLSGQVDELREISNAARGGAKAAQETADSAVAGVTTANERITSVDMATNARITSLDDYEVKSTTVVRFKVGSATLSDDAKAELDQLAQQAQAQRGYIIEVAGFASSDGNDAYNKVLSRRRADAVVQYLADNMVPLRRIVSPNGFGEKLPVADNTSRAGRQENRRVEVKILTSKGIAGGELQGTASNGK